MMTCCHPASDKICDSVQGIFAYMGIRPSDSEGIDADPFCTIDREGRRVNWDPESLFRKRNFARSVLLPQKSQQEELTLGIRCGKLNVWRDGFVFKG